MKDVHGFGDDLAGYAIAADVSHPAPRTATSLFWIAKRAFDILLSVVLLIPLAFTIMLLAVLNPWFNRGDIFFVQTRMGRDCKPFRALKLRTMTSVESIERGPFDAIETSRITTLGRFLRKSRLDELAQVINVLRGDMSLIGPRPDFYDHATVYLEAVPGYRERHAIRPGISGYAQIEVGYVEALETLQKKVAADLYYIKNASLRLDTWIVWRTIVVVFLRKGA